ncbi:MULTISPECIES: LapA family protein [unclassified Campylobacter]|uniref:LapA family protein n=1 Tax=unclassified Campylobacter TaxID=2593542 RepID=UPI003D35755F
MKTRRFVIYSIIYVAIVAFCAFMITDAGSYSLNLLGYEINLPLAVWFAIPVAVFAILAILHIFFHSLGVYKYKRDIKRDRSLYKDMLKEIFLGLASNKEFKTDIFKIPAAATRILSPWGLYKDLSIGDEDIANVVNVVNSVKNGNVVDIKKFKLSKDNALFLQNEKNKINTQPNYYIEILKDAMAHESLKECARLKLLAKAEFADIKRYAGTLSSDEVMDLLERYKNDSISINYDEIFELLDEDKISREQYLRAAIMLKDKLKPDTYKTIFEKLRNSHADADEAYIYALYELVMLDDVREAIANSDVDEFIKIKTLLYLRENGKSVPSSLFFK